MSIAASVATLNATQEVLGSPACRRVQVHLNVTDAPVPDRLVGIVFVLSLMAEGTSAPRRVAEGINDATVWGIDPSQAGSDGLPMRR